MNSSADLNIEEINNNQKQKLIHWLIVYNFHLLAGNYD
jgi:hypothetical protein